MNYILLREFNFNQEVLLPDFNFNQEITSTNES